MSNNKEILTQEALEKMEQDEKCAKNEALKKVIQETHDKEYKERIAEKSANKSK
ncbi:hypothetical protein LGK95_16780 [Clostridium algoriphilum]|uniref:hypothetical protein n=1 Tax=Clostridium algoriphilum TaxID=198347 RepID=UPI001CF16C38|nr:hypothetical protein [Clostridium algoriphilum]MCB2295141.1 hypothetical protein [Clostridium algoriphilum]